MLFLAPLVLLTSAIQAPDQTDSKGAPATDSMAPKAAGPMALEDEIIVRSHNLQLASGGLDFTSRTGRLVLRTEEGEDRAAIFFTAYEASPEQDRADRPLTFCFNGGPGSSSVWLHLGAFGPYRVDLGTEGLDLEGGRPVIPNLHTLLPTTDLVFLDPVTTGYSRAAEGVDDSQFHGDRRDVESVADFIRLYLTRHERWASPIYLAGESYGTTRAAALSLHLETRHGIYPRGLILVSSILNFQTARFDVGNDLPYPLFLPTYAAIAHYHGRLDERFADLGALLDEVEQFAAGEYTSALFRGDALTQAERAALAARIASYTGLSSQYVEETNLRPHIQRFVKELRREEGLTVGRLDGRYTGVDRDNAGDSVEFDPSYAAIQGPYTMGLNDYVRRTLGFQSDLPYEILTGRVRPWSYERAENSYLNVAEDLRGAMARNPNLRVYIANGLYDLATPYFATRYTFDHLGLPEDRRADIISSDFAAGHMMYVKESELEKLASELVEFLTAP